MTQHSGRPVRGNGSSGNLKLTEPPLTREEVITRGERAAQVLGAPVMTLVVQSVMQELADEWVETDPKEVQKREGLHAESRGLARLLSRLTAMTARAMELSESAQRDELAAQQQAANQRANNTGYGD